MEKQVQKVQKMTNLSVDKVESIIDIYLPWAPEAPVRVFTPSEHAALAGCEVGFGVIPIGPLPMPGLLVKKGKQIKLIPCNLLICEFSERKVFTP